MTNYDRLLEHFVEAFDETEVFESAVQTIQKFVEQLYAGYIDRQPLELSEFLAFYIKMDEDTTSDQMIVRLAALVKVFRLATKCHIEEKLFLKDLTEYLLGYVPTYLKNEKELGRNIPAKLLWPNSKQRETVRSVRYVDTHAPSILGSSHAMVRRLELRPKHVDSIRHTTRQIHQCCYMRKTKELLVLDCFTTNIRVYNTKCKINSVIHSSNESLQGQFVISMSWSQAQQRLGVVLRQNYIGFWDSDDGFKFECFWLAFSPKYSDDQVLIRYVIMTDQWVTVDAANRISFWDLGHQTREHVIASPVLQGGIICIEEVSHLKMVAIGSQPNSVSFWDFHDQKMLFRFEADHTTLSKMLYNCEFQLLITNGFDDQICCYALHPLYYDHNRVAQWSAKCSLILAFETVEGSAMLITADDKQQLKVWDIRDQHCKQRLQFEIMTPINQIMYLPDQNMLCVVTSRINLLYFEEQIEHTMNPIPQCTIVHLEESELIILTRRDIRLLDLNNGQLKYILQGIFRQEEEMCSMCLCNFNKSLLIGSSTGKIVQVSRRNGDMEYEWSTLHAQEVHSLAYDSHFGIYHTHSADASIKAIPIENSMSYAQGVLRAVGGIHDGGCSPIYAISFYHGYMVTTSKTSASLIVWQLDNYMPLVSLDLDHEERITFVALVDRYRLLFVGDASGNIEIISLTRHNDKLNLQLVGHINIVKATIIHNLMKSKPNMTDQDIESALFDAASGNDVLITELMEEESTPIARDESDPYRRVHVVQHLNLDVINNQYKFQSTGRFVTRMVLEQAVLVCGTNLGSIMKFDIARLLNDVVPPISQSLNFNAYRANKVNFAEVKPAVVRLRLHNGAIIRDVAVPRKTPTSIKKKFQKTMMRIQVLKGFQDSAHYDIKDTNVNAHAKLNASLMQQATIHDDSITTMNIINQQGSSYLLTSALDGYIKILLLSDLSIICCLSTHQPLPQQWTFQVDKNLEKRYLVGKAFQVIRNIHQQPLHYGLDKHHVTKIRFSNLLRSFESQEKAVYLQKNRTQTGRLSIRRSMKNIPQADPPDTDRIPTTKPKPLLMNTLTTSRSIETVETLRHLSDKHRILQLQLNQPDPNLELTTARNEDAAKIHKELITFLSPNYRSNLVKTQWQRDLEHDHAEGMVPPREGLRERLELKFNSMSPKVTFYSSKKGESTPFTSVLPSEQMIQTAKSRTYTKTKFFQSSDHLTTNESQDFFCYYRNQHQSTSANVNEKSQATLPSMMRTEQTISSYQPSEKRRQEYKQFSKVMHSMSQKLMKSKRM